MKALQRGQLLDACDGAACPFHDGAPMIAGDQNSNPLESSSSLFFKKS